MSVIPNVTVLPQATVQDTFPDVLNEVHNGTIIAEDIWLSCYKSGEPSVHGKVGTGLHAVDRGTVELSGRDGVQFERVQDFKYRARCETLGVDTQMLLPVQSYADPVRSETKLPHQISAFDVSSDTSLLASAFSDGTLTVQHLRAIATSGSPYPPRQQYILEPVASARLHLSTIAAVQLLPGPSPILASAGADFRLHVTPLPSPVSPTTSAIQPSTTLTGHTRALTSLIVLDQTVSGSGTVTLASGGKDGTLRLWDVSTASQLSVLGTHGLKIPTSLAVSAADPHVVWTALSDGGAQAFDARSRTSTHIVEPDALGCGPLASIATCDDGALLLGGGRGVVGVYDPRAGQMRARWTRGGAAPVEAVAALPGGHALLGGEDGLPYMASLDDNIPRLEAELVFGDVEGVRCARVKGDEIWLAGDGGVIRRYAP
ncbi:WD40 repeat-like protein [Peniophora sp. CONT]|nr:WD40 repeat-like protein [Peniophora sp. CONT]